MATFKKELWQKPDSPNAENEEFEGDLSGWTRNYTASADAIDASAKFTASGESEVRENLNDMRRSWLLLQPPQKDGIDFHYTISKQFSGGGELPDGLYLTRMGAAAARRDGESIIWLMMGPSVGGDLDEDNYLRVGIRGSNSDSDISFNHVEGSGAVEGGTLDQESFKLPAKQYFAIIKNGDEIDVYASGDGVNWVALMATTWSGGTIDRVGWLFWNSRADNPITGIMRMDFFRYFPGGQLP